MPRQAIFQAPSGNAGKRWQGEPLLADLLAEPIIRLLMRRDGVSQESLSAVLETVSTAIRLSEDIDEVSRPARRVAAGVGALSKAAMRSCAGPVRVQS